MKNLLLLLAMCLIGTVTYASNDSATNIQISNILKTASNSSELTDVSTNQIFSDQQIASCTATVTVRLYVDGEDSGLFPKHVQ